MCLGKILIDYYNIYWEYIIWIIVANTYIVLAMFQILYIEKLIYYSQQLYEVGTGISFILQMWKLRY